MKNILITALISLLLSQLTYSQGESDMAIGLIRNSSDSGDYFSPGDVLNMGTQNFTIEVKMFVNSFPPIADYGAKIINKGLSTSGTPQNAGYGLRVWNDNGLNKLIFMINNGSSFYNIETGGLETGICYHIAAVRENDIARLYLDGNLVADSTTQSVLNVDTDLFFAIGALSRQPYEVTTEYFDGQIDEVRIWNTVRNENQISTMMDDTLSAAYYSSLDSGLIAYYRCDEFEDLSVGEDGPDDVRDYSANGYHADSYDEPIITTTCNVVNIDRRIKLTPDNFGIDQNYPNPFNPNTVIKYSVPQVSQVQIKVFDVLGNELQTLVKEEKPAGTYEITWNAANLPSGIYFYQLRAENYIATKKMVLTK